MPLPPHLWGPSWQASPGLWRSSVLRCFPLQTKETRVCAAWGGLAGWECPRLPAKHWRAGVPLPQSRFSSKLLPWLLRGWGTQGPATERLGVLLELPQAAHCLPARAGAPAAAAPLGFAGGRVARLC